MALARFQYEPVSLDVNKVCFEEEQDIRNMHQKSRKSQNVIECCECAKRGVMHRNNEYLSCGEVENLGCF